MKKLVSIVLVLIVLNCSLFYVSAASEADVSGVNKSISKDDEVIIPVSIDNNKGIMGFKITVDYDPDKIDIIALTAGDVTSSGNFISNVGDKKGHIDVVWSHHEDVTGAGVLFSITVKALKELNESTEIKLGYSESDTFNSKWEDVKLNCTNIKISGETASGNNKPAEKATEKQTVTDSQVINAVQEALDDLEYDSIDDVKDTDEFINKVNEIIKETTGVDNYFENGFNTLKKDYYKKRSKSVKDNLLKNVEALKVKNAINDALNKSGAKSVEEVKDKGKFVKDVQSNISDNYPDANNIIDEIGTDEAIKLIGDIYEEVKDTPDNNNVSVIIVISIIALATLLFLLFFSKKIAISL